MNERRHGPEALAVRDALRELERAMRRLPRETEEQKWAFHEFNRMIGDMFPMLTWWRQDLPD